MIKSYEYGLSRIIMFFAIVFMLTGCGAAQGTQEIQQETQQETQETQQAVQATQATESSGPWRYRVPA